MMNLLMDKDQLGKEYEADFIQGLAKGLPDSKVVKATKEQDEYQGTDVFLDGIRVDVTFHFSGKDHMVDRLVRYVEGYKLGIRTGNNTEPFKDFVVVIGEDSEPQFVRDWELPNLVKKISQKAEIIADAISDLFCEYEDMMEMAV